MQRPWRDTALFPTFFGIDGRSALALFPLVKISWPTFYMALVGVGTFAILGYLGMTPLTVGRRLRRFGAGPVYIRHDRAATRRRCGL